MKTRRYLSSSLALAFLGGGLILATSHRAAEVEREPSPEPHADEDTPPAEKRPAPESDHEKDHGTEARPTEVIKPVAPKLGQPVNDRGATRYFQIEGEKLVKAGRTLTNWMSQFGRKSCRLKLPNASGEKQSTAEIAARAEQAVAIVGTFYNCGKCSKRHMSSATGFFLTASGALATCRHALANYATNGVGVVAFTRDGKVWPVKEVLAADAANDLLILQVAGKDFTALPLCPEAPIGSPVFVMGHPSSHYYMLTTGVIARHWTHAHGKLPPTKMFSITADFAKGSSGAPVLGETGGVLGVAAMTESVYYSVESGQQKNLQLVVKNCRPSEALLQMIKSP